MSEPIYDIAKQKDLQKRGIPLSTIITPDNHQLLLTKGSVRLIANKISAVINRPMRPSEIEHLIQFVRRIPATRFYGATFADFHDRMATNYLERYQTQADIIEKDIPTSVVELTGLNEITEDPGIDEYQKKEINQFTKNENSWKYSAFANRRGDAVVDEKRVNGTRSSPDGFPSGKKFSTEEVNKANYQALQLVQDFLNPDSIERLIGRFSSSYTNYYSINLPHQTVPLDSRNRLLTNTSLTEYSWNVHAAGNPGHLGDIKILDTLQQVIQMNIGSFWLPMQPVVGSYYQQIRMLVKEFTSQSNVVTEFLDPNENEPTVSYYHYDFNITKTIANKVFLEPVTRAFEFRKPFAQVNTLTISFRTPFDLLVFTPDRGTYTVTYGNPTVFTITSSTTHDLATGDLIYVINSHSGNSAIDILLNQQAGWFITKISNTQWSIPADTSILVGFETGVSVYYGSKRIFFPLEFVCLEQ